MGLDVTDEDVLADRGPMALCRRYNTALAKLGQLAFQLVESVRAGQGDDSDRVADRRGWDSDTQEMDLAD